MGTLTQQNLQANAFRTLGLSGSATQAAIDGAARRMRIWPDPQRIPPTPWDFPLFGPLDRSRTEIASALARLHEPASRLEERLFWLTGETPPPAPRIDEPVAAIATSEEPVSFLDRFNAAITGLHVVSSTDPTAQQTARWSRLLERFEKVDGASLRQRLLEVEQAGDFEKRASEEEVDRAVRELPIALAGLIVAKARAHFDRGDDNRCAAMVRSIRANLPPESLAAPMSTLLDQMEDTIDVRRRDLDAELRDKLETVHSNPAPWFPANFAHTAKASGVYFGSIEPALDRFCGLASHEPDRVLRARSRCAELLALVALGWEWSGRYITAEQTLLKALEMAKGSHSEQSIQTDLARCKPLADRERRMERAQRDVISKETEHTRNEDEARLAEEARKKEEQRLAEAARLEEEKRALERKIAEEARLAEERRLNDLEAIAQAARDAVPSAATIKGLGMHVPFATIYSPAPAPAAPRTKAPVPAKTGATPPPLKWDFHAPVAPVAPSGAPAATPKRFDRRWAPALIILAFLGVWILIARLASNGPPHPAAQAVQPAQQDPVESTPMEDVPGADLQRMLNAKAGPVDRGDGKEMPTMEFAQPPAKTRPAFSVGETNREP